MNTNSYTINKINISNFRGVTEECTIDVGGKHLFLFGPNGFGKSTVVEAIRWCLFGSPAGQQEIEVRNTFFPANASEVTLSLAAVSKGYNVRRRLSPGAPRSRQIITDSNGKELNQQQAFPLLARLGQQTGTQVIFAAQHAAGRRQSEISDFSKVIYFYLKIEKIPELLEKLNKMSEDRRAELQEMAKQIDAFAEEIRIKIDKLQSIKNEILKNPPWGKGSIPTINETNRKVEVVFQEMARLCNKETPTGLSEEIKLSSVLEWNNAIISDTREVLQTQLGGLESRSKTLADLLDSWTNCTQEMEALQNKIAELETEKRNLTSEKPYNDIVAQSQELKKKYEEKRLLIAIARNVTQYFARFGTSKCPVCNTTLSSKPVCEEEDLIFKEHEQQIRLLEDLIDRLNCIYQEIKSSQALLQKMQENLVEIKKKAGETVSKSNTEIIDIETTIKQLNSDIESIRNQIEDSQVEFDRRLKRVNDIKAELRFHSYQKQLTTLENILAERVNGARNLLAEYASVLNTSEDIGKLLLRSFNEQIDSELPALNDSITRVYAQLTANRSYDGVTIIKQPSRSEKMFEPDRLELQVTSSRCPGKSFPSSVLNGQATRALQLVPYFVFSEYWHDFMELGLLLVDDPSESFDTSHLDNLMSVLSSVASHTQIVLASHEDDKLIPLINKHFDKNNICIVKVTDFDPYKGPKLE